MGLLTSRNIALSLVALALVSLPSQAQTPRPLTGGALLDLEVAVGSPVQATVSAKTGLVTFLSFGEHQQTLGKLPAEAPAEARAREFLAGYGAAFGVLDAESLALQRVDERDEVGMEHVRFRQMHQGIPVTGGELTVHLRGSNVVAVNAKTVADLATVATLPVVMAAEASVLAAEALARDLGVTDAELSVPRLELLNRRHLGGRGFATSLAWFIEAKKIDLREYIWIDAIAGQLVLQFSQLTDALDREVHDADDPGDATYGSLAPNLVRDEGDPATGDTDVDTAYDYAGDTYNHFFTEHGRDSYDDAGATLKSWVHYCPSSGDCPYANAFWNGVQMVYGEGFSAADDVVAHELTHAVTEFTANLFYYMQSGALNESFSDIFGETVDQTNTGGTDTPGVKWQMGEDVPGLGAIRNMMDPTLHGDPGRMGDAQFVCGDDYRTDRGGVHSNSGVPNHAYALMVDGGTYNFKTIFPALGLTKAAKIQYRALANYLLSASDFLDNYNALMQSCDDLVGVAGITATDCLEVKDALDAVEMSSVWPCTPAAAAVPDLCPPLQGPSLLVHEDFEGTPIPACPSAALPTAWCTNQPASLLGAFATSGTQSVWAYNKPSAGSQTLTFSSVGGALPAGVRMQFNHAFGFRNVGTTYYDGGVVEYSTNPPGAWTDLGSKIIDGQDYGGTIASCCSNPLGGREAFVRDSWGYTATQFDLGTLAGNTFSFRFNLGTDVSVDEYGWFADDLSIYTCAACVATHVLNSAYNGLSSFYGASASITAGTGFKVDFDDDLTLEAPLVQINNDFTVIGDLEIGNATCP